MKPIKCLEKTNKMLNSATILTAFGSFNQSHICYSSRVIEQNSYTGFSDFEALDWNLEKYKIYDLGK